MLLLWLIFSIQGVQGGPVYTGQYKVDKNTEALLYLTRYGYVNFGEGSNDDQSSGSLIRLEEDSGSLLHKAIAEFQAFSGLVVTGSMDQETSQLMKKPRCGVKDIIGFGSRYKRFVLQGSKWNTTNINYHISKYPRTKRLAREEVDDQVAQSFQVWANVSRLNFYPSPLRTAHIEIRFERYDHGDGDDFDGAGGTLGHAFFPKFGGDIHMDDSEFWTVELDVGTNLKFSLVHEIGHSLGLSHSDVPGAIMAPFYQNYKENLTLHVDDELGIRGLYGGGEGRVQGHSESGSLCKDTTFDTIFTTADLNTYVFRGDYYWKLEDYGSPTDSYPRLISADWDGLPSNIDAGFTTEANTTYILKGSRVWMFKNRRPVTTVPVDISAVFPGIPGDLDAAFVWSGNGKIYFIKDGMYWKYDKERVPAVRSYFPISLDVWSMPPDTKAVLQWMNKQTYFFTDTQYYKFNDYEFEVSSGHPPYPRRTAEWWFGCI